MDLPSLAPAAASGAEGSWDGSIVLNLPIIEDTLALRVVAFGEDVGQLGDVNQGFSGLQDKFGLLRVSDTGIREATILGQGIGLAMRGLRPIAEIQYLDYLLYALQIMSDDLATLRYRTRGGQKAPVIVRTRGHRLEGIWHSGSPMAGILNLVLRDQRLVATHSGPREDLELHVVGLGFGLTTRVERGEGTPRLGRSGQ